MMFSPLVFVHPFRVAKYRPLTAVMSVAWAAFAVIAVIDRLEPPDGVRWGLVATAAYFLALPLLRHSPWAGD